MRIEMMESISDVHTELIIKDENFDEKDQDFVDEDKNDSVKQIINQKSSIFDEPKVYNTTLTTYTRSHKVAHPISKVLQ